MNAVKKNVLAIGECGLDKLHHDNYRAQEKAFSLQIALANQVSKPLIIHCVRSFREVLAMLHENNNIMPFVFHGFNNKQESAQMVLDAGGYLSFGKSLFNPSMEQTFANIPADRLFLETDDSEHGIEEIYRQAAKIRQSTTDQINSSIKKNLLTVFNIRL